MTKKQLHSYAAKTHKWIGLILGVQLLFWMIGGLVMTWLPLDTVRGEHKVNEKPATALMATANFMPLKVLVAKSDKPVSEVFYTMWLGRPVAKLRLYGGGREIRSAIDGALLSPVSKELAEQIAVADYKLSAPVFSVVSLSKHSVDYRGRLPVWQILFDDAENTALYVSPEEGRVVARRSSIWRFYDFFWMLHIMDYDERHDTNNWLVMTTSLFAALFAISGIVLLFFRFHKRDFKHLFRARKSTL